MNHPYSDIPDYRRWRAGVADVVPTDIDPAVNFPFRIGSSERIAAAGSCFAQHVARHLRERGYPFVDAEPAHPIVPDEIAAEFGYGLYSARYGNIYTLLQLLRRAYGSFRPAEDVWEQSGRYFDPFRPAVHANGFATRQEFDADRGQHLAAVRMMFEQTDVFVFTLGLTECWVSREDGAAFPACPGTVAGRFDPDRHAFLNLGVDDVYEDIVAFLAELRAINPQVRLVLSVSPVPLAATAVDRHVLVSTAASKAVLRAAADRLAQLSGVGYFPAYEIITNPATRGAYYADDLRSIREEGVHRVMNLFFRHVCQNSPGISRSQATGNDFLDGMHDVVDVLCEESRLDS